MLCLYEKLGVFFQIVPWNENCFKYELKNVHKLYSDKIYKHCVCHQNEALQELSRENSLCAIWFQISLIIESDGACYQAKNKNFYEMN